MLVKFKNDENVFSTIGIMESRIYEAAKPKDIGWLFGTVLTNSDSLTSTEIDNILSDDGISEITVLTNDKSTSSVIRGYEKVQLVKIVRSEDLSVSIEIQLTKWTTQAAQ